MDLDRLLEVKPESSYSNQVLDEIKIVSYNKKEHAQPFGSYIYRLQKYPGDIDLLENVNECGDHPCKSKDELIKSFKKKFQKIVKEVIKKRGHYYSEIKCGLDERYLIKIGDMHKGIFVPNKDLHLKIQKLYREELLPENEFEIIMGILEKSNNNADDYDIISTIIREHYILRWSAKEIISGIKSLPGNKKITLEKALEYDTLCKIDMITLVNGRFTEITNVYGLGYYDKAGNLHLLNYTADPATLPLEVEKLYYSNKFYSPFKMVKRMFSYARHEYLQGEKKYANILHGIIPFITGNVSFLYQIRSELETIILLLDKFKNPSPKAIHSQISEIKNRLSNIIQIDHNELILLQNDLDECIHAKHNEEKIKILEMVTKDLKKYINELTIEHLIKMGLNPPPHDVLPNPKIADYINVTGVVVNPLLNKYYYETYDWSIIRKPIDDFAVSNFKLNIKRSVERFKQHASFESFDIPEESTEDIEIADKIKRKLSKDIVKAMKKQSIEDKFIKQRDELRQKQYGKRFGFGNMFDLPRQPNIGTPLQIFGHGYQTEMIVPKVRWNNSYPDTMVFYDPQNPLPQPRIFELPKFQTRQNISYYPNQSASYSRDNYNDDIYSQMEVIHGIPQLHNQKNIF